MGAQAIDSIWQEGVKQGRPEGGRGSLRHTDTIECLQLPSTIGYPPTTADYPKTAVGYPPTPYIPVPERKGWGVEPYGRPRCHNAAHHCGWQHLVISLCYTAQLRNAHWRDVGGQMGREVREMKGNKEDREGTRTAHCAPRVCRAQSPAFQVLQPEVNAE